MTGTRESQTSAQAGTFGGRGKSSLPLHRSAQGHERGTRQVPGWSTAVDPQPRSRPQSTPQERPNMGRSREEGPRPPPERRPVVDKQITFKSSSLRGSTLKGNLEGGQADPPQTPPGEEEHMFLDT